MNTTLSVIQLTELTIEEQVFYLSPYRELYGKARIFQEIDRFYTADEYLNHGLKYLVLALNAGIDSNEALFGSTLILKNIGANNLLIVAIASIFPVSVTGFATIAENYKVQFAGAVAVHVRKTGMGDNRLLYIRAGLQYVHSRIESNNPAGAEPRTWCMQTNDPDFQHPLQNADWQRLGTQIIRGPHREVFENWTIDL